MLTVGGWGDFPKVLDGASRLFVDIFGDEVGFTLVRSSGLNASLWTRRSR
jgi:hypothetical protein